MRVALHSIFVGGVVTSILCVMSLGSICANMTFTVESMVALM